MKDFVIICLIAAYGSFGYSQLNCKTKVVSEGSTEKSCFHSNGVVSTMETWDKDHRFGKFVGWNTEAKQLFYYSLRKVGGNASVSVRYFPNGQVKRIDFSDQPDGGIQFFSSTILFDSLGKQLNYQETKYPFEPLTSPVMIPKKEDPKQQKIPPKEEIRAEWCAAIINNIFEIKNDTKAKVFIRVVPKPNLNYLPKGEMYFTLKPNQTFVFDSIVSAQYPINVRLYEPIIISYSRKRKYNRLFLLNETQETQNSKKWIWKVSGR